MVFHIISIVSTLVRQICTLVEPSIANIQVSLYLLIYFDDSIFKKFLFIRLKTNNQLNLK